MSLYGTLVVMSRNVHKSTGECKVTTLDLAVPVTSRLKNTPAMDIYDNTHNAEENIIDEDNHFEVPISIKIFPRLQSTVAVENNFQLELSKKFDHYDWTDIKIDTDHFAHSNPNKTFPFDQLRVSYTSR